MARLSEQLRDWLSRFEIVARGSEGRRYEAVRALEHGRPWRAREEALLLLEELPRSPVALALWADAAEAMLLDHEAVEALEGLAAEVPFRADVWLRLGRARARLGLAAGAALERAVEVGEPVDAADAARLELAERDLSRGDPARAERWLERMSLAGQRSPATLERRIEAWLDLGATEKASRAARTLGEPTVTDGRAWLLRGRLCESTDPDHAAAAFARALILDAPGVEPIVAGFVARTSGGAAVARLEALVLRLGLGQHPAWRAAFATARGELREALAALADGARQGDAALRTRYVAAALQARDADALAEAIALAESSADEPPAAIRALAAALREPVPAGRLAALDAAEADGWAAELRREAYRAWWPEAGRASFAELAGELAVLARELGAADVLRRIEALAVALERPLAVAVVGEFNAGKSSFVNALLGEEVAPVGVLPTTATENRLVWAPERFARIELPPRVGSRDRVVPFTAVSPVLRELGPDNVERVTLYAPLELLRRIELIDTPGFNAPEARHGSVARAALEHAHVAVWLLDASQPLKGSETTVMSELAGLGVPLLLLLNKLDRLAEGELQTALEHVSQGLNAAGLAPLAPVAAFSARLALAGRAGDASALERSRWLDVERLIEHEVVGRSELLREQALCRAARGVVGELWRAAGRRRAEREGAQRARQAECMELEKALARLQTSRTDLEGAVARELDSAGGLLARDLLPVAGAGTDAAAERFIVVRTRALLGPALAARCMAWLGLTASTGDRIAPALVERASALAALAAPWLAGSFGTTSRVAMVAALTARLADELVVVLEHAAAKKSVERPPRAQARLAALAAVIGIDESHSEEAFSERTRNTVLD